MPKQIRKITCKVCKREVDAILLKEYGFPYVAERHYDDNGKNEGIVSDYRCFQKLLVKHHKTGIFMKPRCRGAGRRFTIKVKSDETYGIIGDQGHV